MTSGSKWGYIVSIILVFILSTLIYRSLQTSLNIYSWLGVILITGIFSVFSYFIQKYAGFFFLEKWNKISLTINRLSAIDILVALGGLIVGLVIGALLNYPLSFLDIKITSLPLLVTLACGIVGLALAIIRKEDIIMIFTGIPKMKLLRGQNNIAKILDTSSIVDGRIADICKTGFVEGDMIIPRFVLKELQQVADSQDPLKRSRGRRGLDILNKMRKEKKVNIRIVERDFVEVRDVDAKLIKMAKAMGAKVITNDYNLNKIAELEGVEVLNINELANSLKPYVLPGEELRVQIIREGKESDQGVGYLDDGTMVVVEGGKKYINNVIDTIVTSVLQTPAGRMIFAKPKGKL
ncbi:MAG: PIN domain nuclease [Candidatus Atribacteria bacterium]|nr:PIN domain nuclease [Candidatus Atribacteria bacterium]